MSLWLTLTGCLVLLGYTVWSRRRAVLLPLVLLSLTALPARAQTSGFMLAQGPGKLVDSLIAAGYGSLNLYQTLTQIVADTNPSVAGVITPAFLATLQTCPANSPIFTNPLNSYAGSGVLINADCTAVTTGLQGSGFNGLAGTTTLATVISGVGPAAVVSSSSANPIYNLDKSGTGTCRGGPSCSSVFGIAYAPQGTSKSFVLSNEATGQLITKMLAAGYGNYNLYQTLVEILKDTNPSVFGVLTPAFLLTLRSCPVGSQVHTIQLKKISFSGSAVAVSDDCTVQIRNLRGSAFNGKPGTTTLAVDISGVGPASLVSSTSSNPVTSWNQVITVGSGTATVTYNAFAILYTPGSTPPGAPAPALSPVALLLMGGLLPLAGCWHLRSRLRRGKFGPRRCGVSD